MRNIVDEAGEIIAKATDDHTLVGGHHRLAVAASRDQELFWKDTGVLQGKFSSTYSLMRRQRDATWPSVWSRRITSMLPGFMHLMTAGKG